MEMNFEDLDMQKLSISTDSAQRVDVKNVVICQVVMFTSGVTVIKISKKAHFAFSADDTKKQSPFGKNI